MHDAVLVRRVQGLGDLSRDGRRLVNGQLPVRDPIRERRALDELHDQRMHASRLFEPVHDRNVGMIQRGENLGFAMEAREPVRIGSERVGEHLDGDITIETRVAGAVDLAHTPGPQRAEDLVHTDPMYPPPGT